MKNLGAPPGNQKKRESVDNFEEYLSTKLSIDTWKMIKSSYKGPDVLFDGMSVETLHCPKTGPYSPYQECLQLTDLLLGSVASAVSAQSKRPTKTWFGTEMSRLLSDIRLKPWNQRLGLHRKLSLGYFPSDSGAGISTDGPLEITKNKSHFSLNQYID